MAEITYADAVNAAIKEEMRRDETVFIMGESIRGGIYGVTGGLSQEFGDRVIDTPLSENGFMGAAVGAAAVGMRTHRPVALQLPMGGNGPAHQPGGEDALHVRRTGQLACRVQVRHDLRCQQRGSPHRQAISHVHEHARPQDCDSHDPIRRQGPAQDRDPRQRPRNVLRGQQPCRHTRRG